ncbi:YesL family protein [Aquibacillus salsiterrae]|uniref:YesL family protein n=1 Tax=Aquibacillus salsiterrae TaxID=2950439 RepID=A0A9X4ADW0_9BACI|nr:YesL family protein [Aquibacillus salsiterrae]MDC3416017.1 YesL family protein [Aquibacillus salsiterrae]
MEVYGYWGVINKYCIWVLKFIYTNVLWLAFSILGLGALGLAPSTTALFAVQRQWIRGETEIPVFKYFWNYYKSSFIKSNFLFYIMMLLGWIIYFDLKFFMARDGLIFQTISLLLFILSIWYMIVFVYLFPIFIHFELSLLQYIRFACIVGLLHPFNTIIMLITVGLIYYFMLLFPNFFYLGGISLLTYCIMLFSYKCFNSDKLIKAKTLKRDSK